jgi:hypothetical protein
MISHHSSRSLLVNYFDDSFEPLYIYIDTLYDTAQTTTYETIKNIYKFCAYIQEAVFRIKTEKDKDSLWLKQNI